MRKIIDIYNKLEEVVLVASLAFTVVVLFYQVCSRTFFHSSLHWAEELCRYIFIFQIWIGASTALKYDKHINVELLPTLLKSQRAKNIVFLIGNVIWFLFSVFMIYQGYLLVETMITRGTLSTGMRVPLYIIYAFVPLSSIAICLRLIPRIKKEFITVLTGKTDVPAETEGGEA